MEERHECLKYERDFALVIVVRVWFYICIFNATLQCNITTYPFGVVQRMNCHPMANFDIIIIVTSQLSFQEHGRWLLKWLFCP